MPLKGVLLAGGTGSRLYPLTKVTNKHLLPVGREPMIHYPLRRLVDAGITDILVVTGTEHMGAVVGLLGSGHAYGCALTYRVQDRAGGIAEAVGLAQDFARGHHIAVILGDNIFQDDLRPFVERFLVQGGGARIALKEVPDPHRFGVAELRGGQVVSIEEKPANPKSNYCVTGLYFYDESVFSIIAGLRPSARGELEITDVHNAYIARQQLQYDLLSGWWTDAGTFSSLAQANRLVADVTD